jgi:DNA-binding transcriptional LysR family regulator
MAPLGVIFLFIPYAKAEMRMAVNIHQLQVFYTVAERGSFSAAAQSLHMTQPAVTMQIQALEDYFGTKLFHRSTKKVELSEAGQLLLPYAKQSLALIRDAEAAMVRYAQGLKGKLQMGASMTFAEYIMPRVLGPFSAAHPKLSVSMKMMNTSQIVEEVLTRQLAFGIVEAPASHADLLVEPLFQDELKLVLPKNHPLLANRVITMEDLIAYPFVLREQGSGTRMVLESELIRNQFDPGRLTIAMELGSTGAIKSAVEHGLGLSVISGSSIKHELALGLLEARSVEGLSLQRAFYSVQLKSDTLPLTALSFLQFVKASDVSTWL